ncbi:MAG TPA: GyrI-like domain-containing protein [Dehalococcoidia bacterium]|nr:GyrI-like domain-containing protein [Dehalococcoidia bacterium]
MVALPLVELPEYRLAILPPVDPKSDHNVRRLWVELSLRLEAGLRSEAPGVLSVGVMDRRHEPGRYALGVPVSESIVFMPEGMEELTTPAGRYLNHTVVGPYAAIPAAFEMLGRQVDNAGARRSGVDLEVYRSPDSDGRTATDLFVGIVDSDGE